MSSRQEKAARTRADLLEAATVVFAHKGYLNTTINDITDEAGRAAGSFYNHFDSKESLLLALAEEIGEDADVLITEATGDLADIEPHLEVFWQLQSRHRAVIAALREAALVNPDFAAGMRDYWAEQLEPWVELFAAARDNGAQLPGTPEFTAQLVADLATAFVAGWEGADRDGLAALTTFVERALGG
ncbi:TetR/AcrR family transcriptional regulator [Rhodococcus sp. HNM0569]|uniref:TetR family transcriptional regulator n=1 Tax=Rhodococcus sp. HNM0569 TaxID=2716340 RepID=UPI00146EE80B|nr:TetR/AcrR family transcriptional regulator [Rhodococcus sp. HNM0569]